MKRNLTIISGIFLLSLLIGCSEIGNSSEDTGSTEYSGADYLNTTPGFGVKYNLKLYTDDTNYNDLTIWHTYQNTIPLSSDSADIVSTVIEEGYDENQFGIAAGYRCVIVDVTGYQLSVPYSYMNSNDRVDLIPILSLSESFSDDSSFKVRTGSTWDYYIEYSVTSITEDTVTVSFDSTHMDSPKSQGTGTATFKAGIGLYSINMERSDSTNYILTYVDSTTYSPVTISGNYSVSGSPVEGYGVGPYSKPVTLTDSSGNYSFSFYGDSIRCFYGPVIDQSFDSMSEAGIGSLIDADMTTVFDIVE